jgi:hypothetical protein
VSFFGNKSKPREREAQWWLSVKMCYFSLLDKNIKYRLSLKKSDFNSTIPSMYRIGLSLFTGRMGLRIRKIFTQIYLHFSATEDFLSAMFD